MRRALAGANGWLMAMLAVMAFAPLIGLGLWVRAKGGSVAGADGYLVTDQGQYLNWARQAGEHGLIANLYDLAPGPRSFLHPGLLLSGGLYALGAGPALAYLAWKPVAVLTLWAGARRWSERFLEAGRPALASTTLVLFFASPVAAVVAWAGFGAGTRFRFDFLSGELSASNFLWGYLFTAIAVGLMPLGLLAFERGAVGPAALAGALVSWLQPWQGATYLLVLLGAEALRARRAGERPALAPSALVAAAGAAPLAYYLALSRWDPSWALAGTVNDLGSWPWWVSVIGLAPLVLPAATGWRVAPDDFAGYALRLWPIAVLLVYLQPFGTFPAHALQSVTLPLCVLAFLGVGARMRPALLIFALLVLIVPGTIQRATALGDAVEGGRQMFRITNGERAALRWLERAPERGGVLAPAYSGALVPAYTGRETWTGAGSWTPGFVRRSELADRLFAGRLDRAGAERVVRDSGARFLLSDCHGRGDPTRLLAAVTEPPRRFGCAAVWRVRDL
jgi:hypothetical protein